MQQCDYLASEILTERQTHASELAQEREAHGLALQQERAAAEQMEHRLRHARQTIENMERSWFWRARLVWRRVSGRT